MSIFSFLTNFKRIDGKPSFSDEFKKNKHFKRVWYNMDILHAWLYFQ